MTSNSKIRSHDKLRLMGVALRHRSFPGGIHSLKPTISPTNKDMLVRSLEGLPEIQWLFLVPLKGGRWHIIPQLAVYTTYIPLIYCLLGGLYATYHLLGEPFQQPLRNVPLRHHVFFQGLQSFKP